MKNPTTRILRGDCLQVLKKLPDSSVDSIVTDPPAGISFMGKSWDDDKGHKDLWIHWLSKVMKEAKRVLKPGGHGLVWAIPRTSHWTGNALETAGFEIRDVITHLFGQGFPKSLDISKAIDKEMGAKRIDLGANPNRIGRTQDIRGKGLAHGSGNQKCNAESLTRLTAPSTPEAKQWEGWGTALKPACEFWFLIRKPIEEKTVAKNVLKHSTGAINIDECRIGTDNVQCKKAGGGGITFHGQAEKPRLSGSTCGRFPSNLVFSHTEECKLVGLKEVKTSTLLKTHTLNESDNKAMTGKNYQRNPKKDYGQNGSESVEHWECSPNCAVKTLDDQVSKSMKMHGAGNKREGGLATQDSSGGLFGVGNHDGNGVRFGDSGGASRFFYCAKISSSERNWGFDGSHLLWEKEVWEKEDLNSLTEKISQLSRDISDATLMESRSWSTAISGLNALDQSQKDTTFIIETVLKLITELKTLSASQSSNIRENIQDAIKTIRENGSNLAESVLHINQLKLNSTKEEMVSLLGVVRAVLPMLLEISKHAKTGNFHSTVKPVKLMRYLCKLITPPSGIVLDPFMGSGSTGLAALREGFGFVGIEKDPEYFQIASERIKQTKQLVDLKNEKAEKKKERLKKVFKINEIKAT